MEDKNSLTLEDIYCIQLIVQIKKLGREILKEIGHDIVITCEYDEDELWS